MCVCLFACSLACFVFLFLSSFMTSFWFVVLSLFPSLYYSFIATVSPPKCSPNPPQEAPKSDIDKEPPFGTLSGHSSIDFLSIWEEFGTHLGAHNFECILFEYFFCMFFGYAPEGQLYNFWDDFGVHFGDILVTFWRRVHGFSVSCNPCNAKHLFSLSKPAQNLTKSDLKTGRQKRP